MQPGVGQIRLRPGRHINDADAQVLISEAIALCAPRSVRLILDSQTIAYGEGRCGLHLDAKTLMQTRAYPANVPFVAASCHDRLELAHACEIGVDWVVISPVLATDSHPGAPTLGWTGLRALVECSTVPVYALGGMHPSHLGLARQSGAVGIAAISGLWQGA